MSNPYTAPRSTGGPQRRGAEPASEAPASPESASIVRVWVVAALCLIAAIAYIQRNSLQVAETRMRADLGLSMDDMGWVMGAFFLAYALAQVPSGWLVQRYGVRRTLTWIVGTSAACGGLLGVVGGFAGAVGVRVGLGLTQAGLFPCAVAAVARWLPERRRSLATGLLGGCMSAGGAIGQTAMGALLAWEVGWRQAVLLFAVPGLLFAVWFYRWFRDAPRDHAGVNAAELALIGPGPSAADSTTATPIERAPTPWGRLLRSVPFLALCGQQFCRAAGQVFFASWFATYLRETRSIADLEVGILSSLPLWALVLGCPLGGWIIDGVLARTGNRRWSRQGVPAASMLACALLVLVSQQVSGPYAAVWLISAGSLCAAVGGPGAYSAAIEMGGRHLAIVFAVMNMVGNLGSAAFPVVVPWLQQTTQSWDAVLYLFAGIHFAAFLCWLAADACWKLEPPASAPSP